MGADRLDTVLGKAVAIFAAFTIDDRVLPLAELVRRTGMAKQSTYRVAEDLVGHGLLSKTAEGYLLSRSLFELGMRAATEHTLLEAAVPYLQDLYERTHETVHLGVRQGAEVVYVAKLGGHRQARSPSRAGGRMPLHCTALGKVLLAYAEPALRAQVLKSPLERRTPHTVVAPGTLQRQLRRARETGVAYEREESAVGVLCVAAPVLDADGAALAAMSITGPTSRFRPERHSAALLASARALGVVLSRRATEMRQPGDGAP